MCEQQLQWNMENVERKSQWGENCENDKRRESSYVTVALRAYGIVFFPEIGRELQYTS